jgi:hypothetical protein
MSRTQKYKMPEYKTWAAIKQRCRDPNVRCFERYGGRGIKLCERWLVFENFYADMGPRPEGFTIERIDFNGDYEPTNCKWIPASEQGANRSDNRVFVYKGEKISTVRLLAQKLNIPFTTVRGRLGQGFTVEQIAAYGSPRPSQVFVNGILFKNKKELCKHFGITYSNLCSRLYTKKMSLEQALGLTDV